MRTSVTQFSIEELKAELKRREEAAPPVAKPRDQVDWSGVYDTAVEGITHLVQNGYEPEDFEHWVYESVIGTVYGRDIWLTINKLIK